MSRLTELIKQVEQRDPQLAADIHNEFDALSSRRAFGLNFERHMPETVELPGRPVRRGDKVRQLPERGETKAADNRIWRVKAVTRAATGRFAELVPHAAAPNGEDETITVACDDLVVVAEFRDPIYPGLVSSGKVERGGDKPFHTVINSENFHALQTLLYTHEGKVDAIYIDPPYNTGAKDWKYNNDYVDGEDAYRHSKWLAFMERRLKLAKRLLNPHNSVLIATIDEKEYLRLGLLLEQVYPEARIQMVSIEINPKGTARGARFSRSDEYAYFVMFGTGGPTPQPLGPEWFGGKKTTTNKLRWVSMIRSGTNAARSDRPGLFYPVFLDAIEGSFHSIGESLPRDMARIDVHVPAGTVAVWPIRADGSEGNWQVGPAAARSLHLNGYLRVGAFNEGVAAISYLKSGEQKKVEVGLFGKVSRHDRGHIEVESEAAVTSRLPATQWGVRAHSASEHGSRLLRLLLPGKSFPFPKSLYAVEDALRFFVADKPDALVLDFFAGSGTTAHAVMRLNKQDGGRRRSISVTNNEVSAEEQAKLRAEGLRPGDDDWESLGICDFITKPRIRAAVTGTTPSGEPIKGDYKFTDEFPMSDGFDENAEFFTLSYESPRVVAHNRAFERIAPLLWMRAGAEGRRIDTITDDFDVSDTYGVLFDLDLSREFIEAASAVERCRIACIVTDDDRSFQMVCNALPAHIEPVRLYESYLTNFTINAGVDDA